MTETLPADPPRFGHFRLGFRPQLDGLRGLAIIAVVSVHATYVYAPQDAAKFLPGAFVSVDVFFALSGFLITSLLLREFGRTDKISFKAFYRRRAFRLLPVLYAMLLAQLVYTLVDPTPTLSFWYDLKAVGLIFAYISNWAIVFHLPQAFGTQQTWSLGVEEQFYLLWPLMLLGIARLNSRRLAIGCFIALMGVALFSRELLFHLGVPYNIVYVQTLVRLDVLMSGSLLAYLVHTGWKPNEVWGRWIGYASLIFLFAMGAFVSVSSPWLYHGGFTLIALAAGAVVYLAMVGNNGFARVMATKPMQWVGVRTYSLYLWHYLIFLATVRALPTESPYLRLVVAIGLTLVVSEISHRCLELPFLRIKNRSVDAAQLTPSEAKALLKH